MELNKAIKKLEPFIRDCDKCHLLGCEGCDICYNEVQAIKTVLSELNRLRNKLKDKIIEYKNNSGCKYCNTTCGYYGKCILLQELLHEEGK